MLHELKTWPEYFQPIVDGKKTFEIRYNDRNFQEGDFLSLQEYDPAIKELNKFTGRIMVVKVTYVLKGNGFLPNNYVCMGIKESGLFEPIK